MASNDKDNIEETSKEEHQNLLKSLEYGKPVSFISTEDLDGEEEDNEDENISVDGSSIDVPVVQRFLSITIPLIIENKRTGCINIKVSLVDLDIRLLKIKLKIWFAIILEIILVLSALIFLLRSVILEQKSIAKKNSLLLKAELKALQAQVNPHFLFNALNSLASLIPDNPEEAEKITLYIAELFREILGASEIGWWKIDEELNLIKNYLYIESVRLCERLKYSIDIEPELKRIKIPCLIIHPLVENSIKHAIAPSIYGGTILINIYSDSDSNLIIKICDKLNSNNLSQTGTTNSITKHYQNDKKYIFLFSISHIWYKR